MNIGFKTRIKQIALKTLESYRRFVLLCHGYSSKGIMPRGVLCSIEDPTETITHGDVVHPCVKYIEDGFEGHKWWMVYTPFYAEKDILENPRLCYSDAPEGELPTEWKFYCIVADKPEKGYNSDPVMFFRDGQLYIFWRECNTSRAQEEGCNMLTVGCMVKEKRIIHFPTPQLKEFSSSVDKEVSPTIISHNGTYRAYAVHLGFVPNYIHHLPSSIGSKLYRYKIVYLIDALGMYDINKSYGVAIWDSDTLDQTFHYVKTVQFEKSSRCYQPWHMEVFEDISNKEKGLFAVVQTRQRHGRICLAKSEDRETFHFYKRPLMTTKTAGLLGLYKSSVAQVGSDFYLFYTAVDSNDNNLHRLFVTSVSINELKSKLNTYGIQR